MARKLTACPIKVKYDVTEEHIARSIQHHIKYTRCKNWNSATLFDKYESVALAIRDLAVERMIATQGAYYDHDVKRVYYLSMEFLLGRLLFNNIVALKADVVARKAIENLEIDFESLCRTEEDAGLGNGGLGRLAACFLDGGWKAAQNLIHRLFSPLLETQARLSWQDFKTALQEFTQARYKLSPSYHLLEESGPSHHRRFRVEVRLGLEPLAQGDGPSKKQAAQMAARLALERLEGEEKEKSGRGGEDGPPATLPL